MKKNKLILILGALVIILLGADVFVFLPSQFSILGKISKEIKEKRGALKNLEIDLKNKSNLLRKKESMDRNIEEFKKKFLFRGDVNLVMAKIDEISREMGLDISLLRPQSLKEIKKTPKGRFCSLPIVLSLNTGYHKLAQFLNKLEKLDFYLEVKKLEIKGDFPDTKVEMLLWGIVRE
ncbi:MAG: type 4a pilus biogenesis protein PilO [Candidatus Omnitrophica bacterium]|nr:type 4a pilus biogenesis protein PilO [Candidatus Omnitrophota bacterium]